ncbi:ribonuclease H-like domain-containing protein [Tanacetum coccineum]
MEKTQSESYISIISNDIKVNLNKEFLEELQKNTYHGWIDEDVIDHIAKVLEIVDLIRVPGTDSHKLRMKIFPLSLTDEARQWWIDEGKEKLRTTDEQPNKRKCKAKKFEVIQYSLGPNEEYIAIRSYEYDIWERNEDNLSIIYQDIFKKMDEGWKSVFPDFNTAYPFHPIRRIEEHHNLSSEYIDHQLHQDLSKKQTCELTEAHQTVTTIWITDSRNKLLEFHLSQQGDYYYLNLIINPHCASTLQQLLIQGSLGPKIIEIMKHKLSHGAKIIKYGGQERVAFMPLSIPLAKLKGVLESKNMKRPSHNYVELVTVDDFITGFMELY